MKDAVLVFFLLWLFTLLAMADTHQLSLLPRARRTDPQSSHDAARRVRVGQYDAGIFDLLHRYRALTKNDICRDLGLHDPRSWTTVASRLSQLKNAGKLEWAGRTDEGNLWRLADSTITVRSDVL